MAHVPDISVPEFTTFWSLRSLYRAHMPLCMARRSLNSNSTRGGGGGLGTWNNLQNLRATWYSCATLELRGAQRGCEARWPGRLGGRERAAEASWKEETRTNERTDARIQNHSALELNQTVHNRAEHAFSTTVTHG
ncbi:hypothetical protein Mapa_014091 [Marchantia paleacea]|nr:hypothetical protein Mapa_014091 [Marchantia paleacea]